MIDTYLFVTFTLILIVMELVKRMSQYLLLVVVECSTFWKQNSKFPFYDISSFESLLMKRQF